MADFIGRDEAQAMNLKKYFTGVPCRRGHVAERYVSTGGCLDCLTRQVSPLSAFSFHTPLKPIYFKDAGALEAQAAFRFMESAGWFEAAIKELRANAKLMEDNLATLSGSQKHAMGQADKARIARAKRLAEIGE